MDLNLKHLSVLKNSPLKVTGGKDSLIIKLKLVETRTELAKRLTATLEKVVDDLEAEIEMLHSHL